MVFRAFFVAFGAGPRPAQRYWNSYLTTVFAILSVCFAVFDTEYKTPVLFSEYMNKLC